MTGIKVLSFAPIMGVMELPVDGIEKLGMVAILMVGIAALWRDSSKRQDRLEKVIKENTEVNSKVLETLRHCQENYPADGKGRRQ